MLIFSITKGLKFVNFLGRTASFFDRSTANGQPH